MSQPLVRPHHKAVKEYYRALEQYAAQNVDDILSLHHRLQKTKTGHQQTAGSTAWSTTFTA